MNETNNVSRVNLEQLLADLFGERKKLDVAISAIQNLIGKEVGEFEFAHRRGRPPGSGKAKGKDNKIVLDPIVR